MPTYDETTGCHPRQVVLAAFATLLSWLETNESVPFPDFDEATCYNERPLDIAWHPDTSEEVIEILKVTGIDVWEWDRIGSGHRAFWTLKAENLYGAAQGTIYVPDGVDGKRPIKDFFRDVRQSQNIERLAPLKEFAKGGQVRVVVSPVLQPNDPKAVLGLLGEGRALNSDEMGPGR